MICRNKKGPNIYVEAFLKNIGLLIPAETAHPKQRGNSKPD